MRDAAVVVLRNFHPSFRSSRRGGFLISNSRFLTHLPFFFCYVQEGKEKRESQIFSQDVVASELRRNIPRRRPSPAPVGAPRGGRCGSGVIWDYRGPDGVREERTVLPILLKARASVWCLVCSTGWRRFPNILRFKRTFEEFIPETRCLNTNKWTRRSFKGKPIRYPVSRGKLYQKVSSRL